MAEINIYFQWRIFMPITPEILDEILKDYEKPRRFIKSGRLIAAIN